MSILRPAAAVLVLVLALVAPGGEVAAQLVSEAKISKARELFLVTNSDALRQAIRQQCMILVTMRFAQTKPPIPSGEILPVLEEELSKATNQELPTLADQVAVIFAEHFTEEEMDAVLSDGRSPAPQSMQAKMPAVIERTTGVIRAWGDPLVLGVMQTVEQRLRDKGLLQ